jgi:hypothetical protein
MVPRRKSTVVNPPVVIESILPGLGLVGELQATVRPSAAAIENSERIDDSLRGRAKPSIRLAERGVRNREGR